MAPFNSVFLGVWGVFVIVLIQESRPVSWDDWWTYDGISGPGFWGLINPEWWLCHKGRRQSPVNLEPSRLLFDPNLQPLHLDKHKVGGVLANTGHSVVFAVDNDTRHPVNISGGPLSYRYQFHEIHLHFGLDDRTGSEHTVDGHAFPAELQIFGFNSQLYNNFSDALHKAQGIVAVSLLLQVGDLSNPELRIFTEQLDKIRYGGQAMEIKRFVVRELLPDTKYYMTYDGSTTIPACHETTTWIILNKPIYITKQQLLALRQLMKGNKEHPNAPLGNNFRPPQPLHHRPVRTNIDFNIQGPNSAKNCPTMNRQIYYKGYDAAQFPSEHFYFRANYGAPQQEGGKCANEGWNLGKQLEITPWNVEWTVAGVRSLTTLSLGRDGTSLLREINPLTYQL